MTDRHCCNTQWLIPEFFWGAHVRVKHKQFVGHLVFLTKGYPMFPVLPVTRICLSDYTSEAISHNPSLMC